jgi:hypothetical protein
MTSMQPAVQRSVIPLDRNWMLAARHAEKRVRWTTAAVGDHGQVLRTQLPELLKNSDSASTNARAVLTTIVQNGVSSPMLAKDLRHTATQMMWLREHAKETVWESRQLDTLQLAAHASPTGTTNAADLEFAGVVADYRAAHNGGDRQIRELEQAELGLRDVADKLDHGSGVDLVGGRVLAACDALDAVNKLVHGAYPARLLAAAH